MCNPIEKSSCFSYFTVENAKTLLFAVMIIAGLGGFAAAGVGTAGFFHAGSFSQLEQVHAIILMSAGGSGGLIFFLGGVFGLVKNDKGEDANQAPVQQPVIHKPIVSETSQSIPNGDANQNVQPLTVQKPKKPIPLQDKHTKAWTSWGIEIKNPIVMAEIDYSAPEGLACIVFEIPGLVKYKEKEQPLTLNILNEILGGQLLNPEVKSAIGDQKIESGLFALTLDVLDESRGKTPAQQSELLKNSCWSIPNAAQVVIGTLLHAFCTGEKIYSTLPSTIWSITRCTEKLNAQEFGEVIVSVYYDSPAGLSVAFTKFDNNHSGIGIGAVCKLS